MVFAIYLSLWQIIEMAKQSDLQHSQVGNTRGRVQATHARRCARPTLPAATRHRRKHKHKDARAPPGGAHQSLRLAHTVQYERWSCAAVAPRARFTGATRNAEAANAIVARAERSGSLRRAGGPIDRFQAIQKLEAELARSSWPADQRVGPQALPRCSCAQHARACSRTARSRMQGFCAPSIDRTAVMCADQCVGMRQAEGRRAGACVASHPARWCARRDSRCTAACAGRPRSWSGLRS